MPPYPPPLSERIASVNVADGVDQTEANLIAEAYLYAGFGGLEGDIRVVRSEGEKWVEWSAFGGGGIPGPDVLIDRNTGGVMAEGAPAFKDYSELIQSLFNDESN